MSRPRVPLAKAIATGRVLHDKKRFNNRNEPPSNGPLGPPPKWMKNANQREAWNTFADELPWLNHSHRAIVGIACDIRGKLISGDDVSVIRSESASTLFESTRGYAGGFE
jgi:hypothetical protein